MKYPLYSPGQPVVCTDSFEDVPGCPEPTVGYLYQVVAVHPVGTGYGIELREFPRVGNEAFAFDQDAFAPVNPAYDDAIAALLAQVLLAEVPAPPLVCASA